MLDVKILAGAVIAFSLLGSLAIFKDTTINSPSGHCLINCGSPEGVTEIPENNPGTEAKTESATDGRILLTEEDAVNLVEDWLEARKQIYGDAHDLSLAREHLGSGELNDVKNQQQKLIDADAYWVYDEVKLGDTGRFVSDEDRPKLCTEVVELKAYYESSLKMWDGETRRTFQYIFSRRGELERPWQIEHINTIESVDNCK